MKIDSENYGENVKWEIYLYVALLWNRLVERDSYLLFFVYPYGVGWKNRDLVDNSVTLELLRPCGYSD